MHYRVVAVGRVKDAALRAACDEYLDRLRRYTRAEEREVKDEARILEAIPEGSRLVALSRSGEEWTSGQLADWTARWEMESRDVVFAIGGADALPGPAAARPRHARGAPRGAAGPSPAGGDRRGAAARGLRQHYRARGAARLHRPHG